MLFVAVGPTLWDADLAGQISQALNLQPRNGFEEMIQWTKEGKLWQYPINNEAGECSVLPCSSILFINTFIDPSPHNLVQRIKTSHAKLWEDSAVILL